MMATCHTQLNCLQVREKPNASSYGTNDQQLANYLGSALLNVAAQFKANSIKWKLVLFYYYSLLNIYHGT